MQNSLAFSRASGIISRDSSPSDLFFSFTDQEDPDASSVPRRLVPRRLIFLYRARDDDDVTANVPGTLFSVPDASCPILPLFLSISLTASPPRVRTSGCCIRSDRGTERTAGSTTRTARSDATSALARRTMQRVIRMRSSAPRARLSAKRGPTDTAVIHLAAGFRDSLTFLRIGLCRRRETRDVGRPAARGHISASSRGGQDVTPVDRTWSFVYPNGQEVRISLSECVRRTVLCKTLSSIFENMLTS